MRTSVMFMILLMLSIPSVSISSSHCPEKCRCFGTIVHCVRKGLTEISSVPNTTTILDFHLNRITKIEIGAVSGLLKLEWLSLSLNRIASIGVGAFKGLSRLKTLDLQINRLTTIPNGLFKDLHDLIVLDLNKNLIKDIGKSAFDGLQKLGYLYLNENKLTTLSQEVFQELRNLDTLRLVYNQITSIGSQTFDNLAKLKDLDLRNNPITCSCSLQITTLTNISVYCNKSVRDENIADFKRMILDCVVTTTDNVLSTTTSDIESSYKIHGQTISSTLLNNQIGYTPIKSLSTATSYIESSDEKRRLTITKSLLESQTQNVIHTTLVIRESSFAVPIIGGFVCLITMTLIVTLGKMYRQRFQDRKRRRRKQDRYSPQQPPTRKSEGIHVYQEVDDQKAENIEMNIGKLASSDNFEDEPKVDRDQIKISNMHSNTSLGASYSLSTKNTDYKNVKAYEDQQLREYADKGDRDSRKEEYANTANMLENDYQTIELEEPIMCTYSEIRNTNNK